MNANHAKLAARGVYYHYEPAYKAHHPAAWDALAGRYHRCTAMVDEARAAGCTTVVISSEDFEGLLVRTELAAELEKALMYSGANRVEWLVYVRDQAGLYWSLISEMSKHRYLDPVAMLYDLLDKGCVFIDDPHPGEVNVPYWYYVFDRERYVLPFAQAHANTSVIPYEGENVEPGHALFARLGVQDALDIMPLPESRNPRLAAADIVSNFQALMAAAGGEKLAQAVAARQTFSPEETAIINRLIRTRFAAGNRRVADALPEASR
jgi:hypothetical protein